MVQQTFLKHIFVSLLYRTLTCFFCDISSVLTCSCRPSRVLLGSNLVCTALHLAITRIFDMHAVDGAKPHIGTLVVQADNCVGKQESHPHRLPLLARWSGCNRQGGGAVHACGPHSCAHRSSVFKVSVVLLVLDDGLLLVLIG